MLKYCVSKILITISILSRGFVNKSKINLILCYCGSGVEHHLGKVGVAGPIPASSSKNSQFASFLIMKISVNRKLYLQST